MFWSAPVLEIWGYIFFFTAGFFQPFCVFLHENETKQHDFTTFRKLKERATIIVSWEKWPKKEGVYLKRETDSDRPQKSAVDQKSLLIDCKKPQKVGHRLQSLLIDYKRLQKWDIDYKVYW